MFMYLQVGRERCDLLETFELWTKVPKCETPKSAETLSEPRSLESYIPGPRFNTRNRTLASKGYNKPWIFDCAYSLHCSSSYWLNHFYSSYPVR